MSEWTRCLEIWKSNKLLFVDKQRILFGQQITAIKDAPIFHYGEENIKHKKNRMKVSYRNRKMFSEEFKDEKKK